MSDKLPDVGDGSAMSVKPCEGSALSSLKSEDLPQLDNNSRVTEILERSNLEIEGSNYSCI